MCTDDPYTEIGVSRKSLFKNKSTAYMATDRTRWN